MTRLNFEDAIYLEDAIVYQKNDGQYMARIKIFFDGYYEDFYAEIDPEKAVKLRPLHIYEAVQDSINDAIERWAWRIFWEQEIREDETNSDY